MNDYSLTEKLKILMNMVSQSPLFIFSFMVAISLLIFYIICLKKNKKINKWIFISIWAITLLILIIRYNSVVLNLINEFFDSVFMALYFPNFSIYIAILIFSNFFLLYSLIKKNLDKLYKIINFLGALFIDMLFILIVDVVNTNSLDIKNSLTMYSNSNLLVLLELSMSIFVSWILANLFISAKIKLQKYDNLENVKLPEIVFEDI